jgi:hypothetical protein
MMAGRLAAGVRVRRESWGLLFYAPSRHKVLFVRSGDWLEPGHFDGTRAAADIVEDIAARTGTAAEIVERTLSRLTARLAAERLIADEVR